MEAYLFTHFAHGNTPDSEQIYFSVSKDGMEWKALNKSEPIFRSEMGERGLRDPFIIPSYQRDKFYMIATDLSIHYNGDWSRAQTAGSKSIMVRESPDLVNWSEQRMVEVAAEDAGCTWAPEAIHDREAGDYMVFWASKVKSDNYAKQRIYSAKTRDFVNFTEPEVYIEKDSHIIDTTFIENEGKYYRFSKDESYKSIIMEVSDSLMGKFEPVESFSLLNVQGYEGPICFKFNGEDKWCLLLDNYAKGEGYKAFVSTDLASGEFEQVQGEFKTPYLFRHGGVIPITIAEYKRLVEAYCSE